MNNEFFYLSESNEFLLFDRKKDRFLRFKKIGNNVIIKGIYRKESEDK